MISAGSAFARGTDHWSGELTRSGGHATANNPSANTSAAKTYVGHGPKKSSSDALSA